MKQLVFELRILSSYISHFELLFLEDLLDGFVEILDDYVSWVLGVVVGALEHSCAG